ncbi:MAG: N-formylglutamate deformylase [Proteobacteria bacterium]|nr:N-formylglutamate deformylase [Pseudomonadota bacterium]
MMLLWSLQRGDGPLIVDVPHAGTHLPDAIALRMTAAARRVPDTDWHVDRLYGFVRDMGATLMAATHSRYVVDLNRDPSGTALYPGADNTELCPTRAFDHAPLYRDAPPDAVEIDARIATFFTPYHDALAAEVARVKARHGYAVVLDGHSIPSAVPRFFDGRLPDLNLGTAGGTSCAPALERVAASTLAGATGFSHVVNGRFKGGWITRRFGTPATGVHALQLEMTQASYCDERAAGVYDEARAAPLVTVLERLCVALLEWRPR